MDEQFRIKQLEQRLVKLEQKVERLYRLTMPRKRKRPNIELLQGVHTYTPKDPNVGGSVE